MESEILIGMLSNRYAASREILSITDSIKLSARPKLCMFPPLQNPHAVLSSSSAVLLAWWAVVPPDGCVWSPPCKRLTSNPERPLVLRRAALQRLFVPKESSVYTNLHIAVTFHYRVADGIMIHAVNVLCVFLLRACCLLLGLIPLH